MNEASPMPSREPSTMLRRMLAAKRIAVVGLSDDPARPSYGVAAYMLSIGKEILPVNPTIDAVQGLKAFASLEAIDGPVDLVDVFRRPEFCPAIAQEAVKIGAKGLWLQVGIVSPEAKRIAEEAGLDYVENRCLMVEERFDRSGKSR